jgi:hypothetical protein
MKKAFCEPDNIDFNPALSIAGEEPPPPPPATPFKLALAISSLYCNSISFVKYIRIRHLMVCSEHHSPVAWVSHDQEEG